MKLIAAAMLLALSSTSSAQTAQNPIDDLRWMIGHWRAVEVDGADTSIVYLNCSLADNSRAILYNVEVETGTKRSPKYQGMYYWMPPKEKFGLTQVDANGNVAEGTYEQNNGVAEQRVTVTSDTTTFELRSHYTIEATQFRFVGEFRSAAAATWKPAVNLLYERLND